METRRLARVWNSCQLSNFSEWNYNGPTLSKNQERYLLIHHLAAEQKQDAFFPSLPAKESRGFFSVLFGVCPQVILHAEEEGSGDVGDRQPLWPSHRMDLGCTHPQGQTPEKPAVWVDSKTTNCTFWYPLNLRTYTTSGLAKTIDYRLSSPYNMWGFSEGQTV